MDDLMLIRLGFLLGLMALYGLALGMAAGLNALLRRWERHQSARRNRAVEQPPAELLKPMPEPHGEHDH